MNKRLPITWFLAGASLITGSLAAGETTKKTAPVVTDSDVQDSKIRVGLMTLVDRETVIENLRTNLQKGDFSKAQVLHHFGITYGFIKAIHSREAKWPSDLQAQFIKLFQKDFPSVSDEDIKNYLAATTEVKSSDKGHGREDDEYDPISISVKDE